MLGALLALAVFSFESGLAHMALARDDACRMALAVSRVAPAPGSGCMSELEVAATSALARGPAGFLLQANLTLGAWLLSGVVYAAAGGACAQAAPGRAVLIFLAIQVLVVVAVAFVLFIGPHLAR